MDRISKFLQKRTAKERQAILAVVELLAFNELEHLDIKKLAGFKDRFRVRVGNFRIIFEKQKNENIVLKIDKRDEQTYR